MNYKKLLKNALLGVSTLAVANSTVFAITLEEFLNTPKWKPQKQIVRDAIKRGDLVSARNQLAQVRVDNPDQAIKDLMAKLDVYSQQMVAQHIDDNTLFNLVQVNKKNEWIADRMRINPVAITERNKALYSQINTQQIFDETDWILDENSKVEIYKIKYRVNGLDIFDISNEIHVNNQNTQSFIFEDVIFKNIENIENVLTNLANFEFNISLGTISLFFDEFENEVAALQIIQNAKNQNPLLIFKKIVFKSTIPFATYAVLKQNPICFFSEVIVDLESGDIQKILT